jgi:hypothetical protein
VDSSKIFGALIVKKYMVAIVKKHREMKAKAALEAAKLVETPTERKKGIKALTSPLI